MLPVGDRAFLMLNCLRNKLDLLDMSNVFENVTFVRK